MGSFRHRLNDEYAATAWFAWLGDFPPLKMDTAIGLSYQRSYRMWPTLIATSPYGRLIRDRAPSGAHFDA